MLACDNMDAVGEDRSARLLEAGLILASELSKEQVGEMLRVVLMVREMAGDAASPIGDGSFATMRLAAQREFKAAISQLRVDSDGRTYNRRKRAEGKNRSRPSGA